MRHLEALVSNHQKLLEQKERESREKNMVVLGIEESLHFICSKRVSRVKIADHICESYASTWNVKMDKLIDNIECYDVILLSETWLK